MQRTRIVLVDDHIILLEAFKSLLQPEFEVVATFSDGLSLLEAAPVLDPDVILLDINMPRMNGLTLGRRLKEILPGVKLIYLTMSQDLDFAAEAFRLGASGYVLKTSAANELFHAIHEVSCGRSYISPLLTNRASSFFRTIRRKRKREKLTLRQKEVLQLLAEGRSMKEVAFTLKVSPRTIAFHKYAMMEHLHVKTSAELIQFAVRSSLCTSKFELHP